MRGNSNFLTGSNVMGRVMGSVLRIDKSHRQASKAAVYNTQNRPHNAPHKPATGKFRKSVGTWTQGIGGGANVVVWPSIAAIVHC